MKSKILWLLIICLSFSQKEHYFEGSVSYNFKYLDNDGNNINKKFDYQRSLYLFRSSGYDGMTIGYDTLLYSYNAKTNKCFYQKLSMPDSDCFDYGLNQSNSLIYTKNETKKVKGKDCIIIYEESPRSKSTHYFSRDIKINPTTFINHKAYQWDEVMKLAKGGIVLRSEHVYSDHTLIMEYEEIKEYKLEAGKYEDKCK